MSGSYFMLVFFMFLFGAHFYELTLDKKTSKAEISVDRWTLVALGAAYFLMISCGLYEFFISGGTINYFTAAAGFFLLAARFAIKYWSMNSLGVNWSSNVEIKESHELVKTGPYAFLRHPVYFGRLLEVAAIGLILKSLYTFLFSFSIHLLLIWIRISNEERALVEKFGADYTGYREKTGGLLPKL